MDQKKIEKEAKEVLDKFARALEKVEKEQDIDSYVDRDISERKEGLGKECDKSFKKRILENAPNKDDDFIIAERKGW